MRAPQQIKDSWGPRERHVPPLSQNKAIIYFGYPDRGNSYLRSPPLTHEVSGGQKIYRAFLCITLNPQSGDSSGVMLGVRSVALLHLYLSSLSANNLHNVTIYLRNVLTSKNIFFIPPTSLIKNYESYSIRIVNNLLALVCRTTRWSKSYLCVSMPNSPCRHCVLSSKL